MKKIVVIGGGASGLMASIWAARTGASVTLLEHNERTGKKILATGNGKCNLTNLVQDSSCYRCSEPDFPWKIVSQFPFSDTIRFFSQLGIYTKNKNGWMYPYSEQAAGVAQVLEMEARYRKVKIKTKENVIDIQVLTKGYQVITQTWHYDCDCVILCCGSSASQVEGSSDSGYHLAAKLGHRIIPPMPALTALRAKGNYFGKWAGTRMDGVISLEIENHVFKKERGEILFTDYGISGIAVFQLSRYAVRAAKEGCQVICHLDLMPDLTEQELLAMLQKRMEDCPYKSIAESLVGLLPAKMISVLADRSSLEKTASHIKNWVLTIKDGCSMDHAQVCSGGVDVTQLTEHLESRLHPGLYFAGELVDVDGPCGGYNLQWAWSSGAVAGKSAAFENERSIYDSYITD